jgi:RNA polymerase sigma-70 factor, ECF subfamily
MAYRADHAGGTAILADVLTAPGPQLALSAPAMRQGNSVARLRTIDRQAAEELFNASYPKLAGWVRRLVDDDDTAHEIASEAFTRLLARWSGLENPQSYLYMIATNLVRDHWRKSGRERRAIRALTAAAPADAAYHPAQDVDVRALIESLPERLRSIFLLHYYGGFGVREVAAMLHMPEGTVKADLHHARARLKAVVQDAPGGSRG